MTLKFLVDVGVGKGVEESLRLQGHDVLAVREVDPRMEDTDILALAVQDQRLVVTMDKDFGELIYHSNQPHAGVLLLRLEEAPIAEKVRIVNEIVKQFGLELPGNFSVFSNEVLRIRH